MQKLFIALATLFLLSRCGNSAGNAKENPITKLLATTDEQRKLKFELCLANQTESVRIYNQTITGRDQFIKKLTVENYFDDNADYVLAEEFAIYEETHLYDAFIIKLGEQLRLFKYAMSNGQEVAFNEVDLASARVPTSYTLGGKPTFSDVKLDASVNDFIQNLEGYRGDIPCSIYQDQLYIYSLSSFSKNDVHWTSHFINHLNCFDKHYKFDCDKIINSGDAKDMLEKLDNLFFYVGAN